MICVCVVEKWNKGDETTGCYTIYGIVTREQEEQRERGTEGCIFYECVLCCICFCLHQSKYIIFISYVRIN